MSPQGSAFPREVMPREVPTVPLGAIAAAARAATPWSLTPRRREVFAALAVQQGWREAAAIARACGMSISGARRVMQRAQQEPEMAAPASLCLGDERLRRRA